MTERENFENLTLLDPGIQECPFAAYEYLRSEAPVYRDPQAGFYVVTRYEDIRAILLDKRRFSSSATVELARDAVNPARAAAARRLYDAEGWQPTPTLSLLDEPRHGEVRAIFQHALRPRKVNELDSYISSIARTLVDDFLAQGRCEAVRQYSVPLPLMAICSQVGVPIEDIWTIKRWTDAWMRRFSLMLTDVEEEASVRQEIEFQHYFVEVVEGLRAAPNGSILSDLVSLRLSDGSALTYGEIVSHLLGDLFVGGSETSTNAISEGILLLCQHPDQYALLMSDIDRHLPRFIEETLRLQTPVQGLYRVTVEDVTVAGVKIPARSLVNLRFAAANRDSAKFACPEKMDIERPNAASHLAFGSGIHHCLGAPLARREMFWAFDTLLKRCQNIRLVPGENDLTHTPGLMLRALKQLHIAFDIAQT